MMKKLYDRSEIWFAVGTIVLYVMVMGNLKANFGTESIYSVIGLLMIDVLYFLFIYKHHLIEKYALVKTEVLKKYLYFIPLVLIATVNLWFGVQMHYDVTHQIYALTAMALTGFAEEIVFRGFLFRAIAKDNLTEAIIISSITFGTGHIINLFTGEATMDTILQMMYAIAIGFAFAMVLVKSGSLLPCIITHSVINVTAELSGTGSSLMTYVQVLFLLVVAGGYALYLYRCVKE